MISLAAMAERNAIVILGIAVWLIGGSAAAQEDESANTSVRPDTANPDLNHRIESGEPYFTDLRSRWSAALRAAHQNIPRPPYKDGE